MGNFSVSRHPGPGNLEVWKLMDAKEQSTAELVPSRGGLITRFEVAGQNVLYLDAATLADSTKNVRGGIPLLFPIAGKLPDGKYQVNGRTHALGQHGFARNMPWEVVAERNADAAEVDLLLQSTPETLKAFPFAFEMGFTLSLKGRSLSLSFRVRNVGNENLPLHFGLHPYFFVPDKQKGQLSVQTDGTRAYDNRAGVVRDFSGFDFSSEEVDLHILNHRMPGTQLALRGPKRVDLAFSPEFRMLVVWAQKGKDFVCVEPWTALTGALARGEGLLSVAPGTERRLNFSLAVAA